MKQPKIIPLAVAAMLAAASLSAKALSVTADDAESGTVAETPGFKGIVLIKAGSPIPASIKDTVMDIEASCMVHGAIEAHHGTPGITYRFKNNAPYERHFRLYDNGVDQSAAVSKAFTIPPGGTTEFTLFMPLSNERGDNNYNSSTINLLETTPGKPHKSVYASRSQLNGFCRKDESEPSLLLSAKIAAKKMREDLTTAMQQHNYTRRHKRTYYSRRYSGKDEKEIYTFSARQFKFGPQEWPRDWRCYSTYDAIVITAGEYGALPDEVKSALDVYRLLGGAVIVTGGQDGFASTVEAARALSDIDDSFDALTGDLDITSYYYSYSSKSDILVDELKRIPIETKATLPLKTLLAILGAFALVVVPLTIFRSVKKNARMRLVVLLPAASAAIAIAIAAFAYAFFGVTPYVRLQSVTILDQMSKKALTRGQFGIFSPVSIGDSLAFPLDAAFRLRHAHSESRSDMRFVDVSDVQRLQSGWTSPLVSSFFDFEQAAERSERLDFRVSPSGEVTVVNLLGATVSWGQANVRGEIYAFADLPPGGEAKARKTDVKQRAATRPRYPFYGKTSFGRDWDACVKFAKSRFGEEQPGEYVVEVEGSPFFPNPLTGRKSHASAAGLVYGRFKEVAE